MAHENTHGMCIFEFCDNLEQIKVPLRSFCASDAAPPSAPTGLRYTALSSTSMTLSWSLPTTDYGADYVLFLTYEDTSNDEGSSQPVTEDFDDQRSSQTITSLQPGARYWCCISATNSAGSSQNTCTSVTTTEIGIITIVLDSV